MNEEKLIELLEDKEDATRVYLIGSGIVCGLQVFVDGFCNIYLTKGVGLTSYGHLININRDLNFKYYRAYKNETDYPLFNKKIKGKSLQLWELLAKYEDDPDNAKPLAPQTTEELQRNSFVENKIMLLFLESIPKDEKPETKDFLVSYYDYRGSEKSALKHYRVRFLVTEQAPILQMMGTADELREVVVEKSTTQPPYGYGDELFDRYTPTELDLRKAIDPSLMLKELRLRRFGYGIVNTSCKLGEPDWEFPLITNLEVLFDAYKIIIDRAITALSKELHKIQLHFLPILTHRNKEYIDDHLSLLERKWTIYRESAEKREQMHYIQYFYDLMRDLYKAYNELREELIELMAACPANVGAYPRHLLLGRVKRGSTNYQPSPIRHEIQQPPIYNGNADRLVRVKMYHWRILMMIRGFYLPDYIIDPEVNPHCGEHVVEEDIPKMDDIRITPSVGYGEPLDQQSIPYYFPLSSSRYSVHRFWNYQRSKTSMIDHILSYYAQTPHESDDNYTEVQFVKEPLIYSLDAFPFYRIEGHIGKKFNDAEGMVKYLKTKYNLGFDVISVRIDNLTQEYPWLRASFNGFVQDKLGAEHLSGVVNGGTFVLVYDTEGCQVVADFSLPYLCCAKGEEKTEQPKKEDEIKKPEDENKKAIDDLKKRLEKAKTEKADDLSEIKGIGDVYRVALNKAGITSFKQISVLKEKDLDAVHALTENTNIDKKDIKEWVKQAKELMKKE